MLAFLGGITALMLAGCAATGDQFSEFNTPKKGNGDVYIYRPSQFLGGGVAFTINLNDQPLGVLRNGGYLHKELPTGVSFLSASSEVTRTQKVNINENEPSCVRFSVGVGFIAGRPVFEPVDLDTCKFEIKKTKLSN